MPNLFRHTAFRPWGFLLLCGALLFFSPSAEAQSTPQSRFDEANSLLLDGEYREALRRYRVLENGRHVSGALYLNMGIACSNLDSLGKAKYYFMKAKGYGETRDRARSALQYVESRFSRQSAVLPKLPWQRAVEWLQENIGARTLLGGGLLLLNLGALLFVIHWFRPRWRRLLRGGGITLLTAGLLLIALSFYARHIDRRYSPAVMVRQEANVREQPGAEAPVVSQAYEGYTFTVDHRKSDELPGWYYIRMSNGLYGWIPSEHLMVL